MVYKYISLALTTLFGQAELHMKCIILGEFRALWGEHEHKGATLGHEYSTWQLEERALLCLLILYMPCTQTLL